MRDENLYLDRENQILAINKTFESAKKPITSHPGKPGVKPVEVLPVFPDFELWKYPFAQVMFDADPAPIEKEKEMSQAMIRGVMDESGEQFVAYFLPSEDTMNKRKIDEIEGRDYIEEEEYEYAMAREYNWNVKNKASKGYEENYFFVLREDGLYYNELETRVKLSKRRVKLNAPTNSKLVVKHRQLNDQEVNIQELRMTQLEPPQEEEEIVNEVNNENDDGEEQMEQNGDNENEEEAAVEKSDDEEESEKSVSDTEQRNAKRKSNAESDSENEKSSSSSESSDSSGSESDAKNSSSSESSDESDSDEDKRKRRRQEAADIFGSDSD